MVQSRSKPGDAKAPLAARLRDVTINHLIAGKEGLSPAFQTVRGEIEARLRAGAGRPSRVKSMAGELKSELIAFLALRSAVSMLLGVDDRRGNVTVHGLADAIGTAVEAEVALHRLRELGLDREAKPAVRRAARDKLARIDKARRGKSSSSGARRALAARESEQLIESQIAARTDWGNRRRMEIGADLINILCTASDLFRLTMRAPNIPLDEDDEDDPDAPLDWKPLRKRKMFDAKPAFWDVVKAEGTHLAALTEPRFAPLRMLPKPWSGSRGGGYETAPPLKLLKRKEDNAFVQRYDEALARTDLSLVCSGVNALQATAWTINKGILEVIQAVRADPAILEKVDPARPDAMPPEKRDWDMVTRLDDGEPFYFAYQLDYRGRAYPLGSWLNPQGDDFARGVLCFAQARRVTKGGRRWLAIHGANLMKRASPRSPTLDERIAMIERATRRICACARNPLKNLFWLKYGKDKHAYEFLAFCLEWAALVEAERRGKRFASRLPVSMDGTCNGFQHFSAMLRDEQLAALTNVAPADEPGDLYSHVAEWINASIEKDGDRKIARRKDDYLQMAERKLAKAVVMIIPYGATAGGIEAKVRDYIIENGGKRDWGPRFGLTERPARWKIGARGRKEIDLAAEYFARQFTETLKERLPRAWKIREWLQECCDLVVARKRPFVWMSPIGLPVLQSHFRTERIVIEALSVESKSFKCILREATDTVSLGRQSAAASPNFVHALDASHMLMTAAAVHARGVTSLRMIHDSYATHASDAPLLARLLRLKFCELYSNDVIAEHHKWIAAVLHGRPAESDPSPVAQVVAEWSRDLCPPPPDRGKLTVDRVKRSHYFFC
jgi:DNA-directed RNA polymerase